MPTFAVYVAVGLVVATIVVLRLSMSNRIGGEPRRSWFRRPAVKATVAPGDTLTDAFANDLSMNADPNFAAVSSNSNSSQNAAHRF